MALTKSRGNMYPFVTHTWNAIKGICFHDCPYCYMKKFDGLLPIRFDPKELEVNLGNGNFIFVGNGRMGFRRTFGLDCPGSGLL